MNPVISEFLALFDNLKLYTFKVHPNTKPRMTRKDAWPPFRDCVVQYHNFKDALRAASYEIGVKGLKSTIPMIIFYVSIPKTIEIDGKRKSTKKMDLEHAPVFTRPDADNYLKAFFDAMEVEDNFIHTGGYSKRYSKDPRIEMYVNAKI